MPRSLVPSLLARTLVPLAGLGGALSAQGAVHIVDDDGGAGVAFTEIQPAVDAAAPGDVIVVRAGSYDGFEILGKPLEILGEGADQVTVGVDLATLPVRIEGTPAGNGTALSGLSILGYGAAPLEVRNNDGRVSLSGLHIGSSEFGNETACAVIASSDLVLLQSSTFDSHGWDDPSDGLGEGGISSPLTAIKAVHSTLWVMDSTIWGGWGQSLDGICDVPGPAGAPGMSLEDSVLYLADASVTGGKGGYYLCGSLFPFEIPGPGGTGIEASGASFLKVVRGEVRGGSAACDPPGLGGGAFALSDTSYLLLADAVSAAGSPPACPGETVKLTGGAHYVLTPTNYPTLRTDDPVAPVGGTVQLELQGEAAAPASLFFSTGFGPVAQFPGIDGATALDLSALFPLGTLVLDGAGMGAVTVHLPPNPGLLGLAVATQGVVLSSSGAIAFTSPAEVAIAKEAPEVAVPALATLKTVTGPSWMGASVAALGDLGADGFSEYAVGAPQASAGGSLRGSVLLFSSSGVPIGQVDGTEDHELLGTDVADAGDVNGDGVPDQIIGAPGTAGGKAIVRSGAGGSVLWVFQGDEMFDGLGQCVAGAGDVDLDGVPDLLSGSQFGDNPLTGEESGHVQVLSGATGAKLYVFGGHSFGGFATDAAGAGDLNLDGVPDVLVGASGDDTLAPERGAVHAYSGADGSRLWRVFGDAAFDQLGEATAALGDLDGDGAPEVLAGAPGADGQGLGAGLVRVLSGATGATRMDLFGSKPHAHLGHAVAGAGDVDGDGLDDIYAGAPQDYEGLQPPLVRPGSATLFSGASGLPLARNFGDPAAFPASYLGSAVAALGDVDGDAIPELLVGAQGQKFARVYKGQ